MCRVRPNLKQDLDWGLFVRSTPFTTAFSTRHLTPNRLPSI
jgi:hypothetical protein